MRPTKLNSPQYIQRERESEAITLDTITHSLTLIHSFSLAILFGRAIHTNVNKTHAYVCEARRAAERSNISTYDLAVSSTAGFAWNSCKFDTISRDTFSFNVYYTYIVFFSVVSVLFFLVVVVVVCSFVASLFCFSLFKNLFRLNIVCD